MDHAGRLGCHAGQFASERHPGLSRSGEVEGRDDGSQSRRRPSPLSDYAWTLVDLVVVNRGEAIELAGGAAEGAARSLCKKGAGAVVLTLGDDGAAFFSADETFRVAAPRVTAVDAVAAGDVFCGVLIAAKVLGRGWREAVAAATEAASASVARTGVFASFPSREEMAGILQRAALGRLEEHSPMTEAAHSVARMRENALKVLFGRPTGVLIGVVHLLPLPGSPDFARRGRADLCTGARGREGICRAPASTASSSRTMATFLFRSLRTSARKPRRIWRSPAERIRRENWDLPIGVNVLANAAIHALAVASAAGARFVRVNQWANAYVANEGLIEGAAARAMRYRSLLQARDVKVFADAHVKHGAHAIVQDRPIAELVRDVEFFNADVVIFTGQRTGHAADFDYLRKIRAAASLPTLVGSGVDSGNVNDILSIVDGVIVASALKVDGCWWNPVDDERARQFVERARKTP